PVEPVPQPPPVAAAELTEEPRQPRSRLPFFVLGGVALAGAGVAIGLAVTGFNDKARVDDRVSLAGGVMSATVSMSQAHALAASANARLSASVACTISAAVIAVAGA